MEGTYWIEAILGIRENKTIRYSQSDNENPGPPSSPVQRAAHCGRISTVGRGEGTKKKLNKIKLIMQTARGYQGKRQCFPH